MDSARDDAAGGQLHSGATRGKIMASVARGQAMAIINFVRDYEKIAKFQLGRYVGLRGPGVVFVIPFIQSAVRVDQRETFFDVLPQTMYCRLFQERFEPYHVCFCSQPSYVILIGILTFNPFAAVPL